MMDAKFGVKVTSPRHTTHSSPIALNQVVQ